MGNPQRGKRTSKGNLDVGKKARTKRRTKDLDQIHEDLLPANIDKLNKQPVNLDLPGFGQFYCIECARHFINAVTLADHKKSKVHRRRLKELKEPPYSMREAEMASGMSAPDTGRREQQVQMLMT